MEPAVCLMPHYKSRSCLDQRKIDFGLVEEA